MCTQQRTKLLLANPQHTRDDARSHYLDTVPDEIARIFLRFLSDRPQNRNWRRYISIVSINTALDIDGALARAASLEFHSLEGQCSNPINDAASDASILRTLVPRLHLYRLVLKLDGYLILPDLLRGCGAELRELDLYPSHNTVVTETEVLAISTHCMKLFVLAIHGNRFEGTLAPIWRSLGSTLAWVYFGRYDLDAIAVPDLVEHCANLKYVDCTFFHPFTDVLVALGSRIRVLNIKFATVVCVVVWREVYTACTNLEAVHLVLENSMNATDILCVLRPKLVSLGLPRVHRQLSDGDEIFAVLSACPKLERVDLHQVQWISEELLRKLLESLKSVTELTYFMGLYNDQLNKYIIDVISCNLTNLESLTLSTDMLLNWENVNPLADLPHLKSLRLAGAFLNIRGSKPEEYAVKIMKRLKDCAQLVQLEIDDENLKDYSPLIAEAAVLYKRKYFDMFICGVQYRTW